ncbi:MAG: 2-phospho-L-lactate guanylyltransferase [Chloroflexi bacterium]|nr:2-phospho-L-lactate guanylyltransferase [Chloroflexota bacterium]
MSLWGIIPVKPFSYGKSRLADRLSVEQRILLNRSLAENTLTICKSVPAIEHLLIVSSGREMHRFAIKCGVEFVEEPVGGINAALETAAVHAVRNGAGSLLVLHGDLPSLRKAELEILAHAGSRENSICIVSDHHKTGTNALLLNPPDCIPFLFGEGSYLKHVSAARYRNIEIVSLNLPSISFDLDTIEDLEFALYREILPKELLERMHLDGGR